MSREETIPVEVLLDDDGHLTEVAVTVLGDGQITLVPSAVATHAECCSDCCHRVGEAALLSSEVGEVVTSAMPHVATSEAREPSERDPARAALRFPVLWVAAAMLFASLGLLPTLYQAPQWVERTVALLSRLVPVVAKGGYLILKHGHLSAGPMAFALPCASGAVLVAVGLLVAKRLPHVAMVGRGA